MCARPCEAVPVLHAACVWEPATGTDDPGLSVGCKASGFEERTKLHHKYITNHKKKDITNYKKNILSQII